MMRRTRKGRSRHHQEAFAISNGFERLELIRRHEALDFVMLARGLEILPDGEEIDVGRAKIIHDL